MPDAFTPDDVFLDQVISGLDMSQDNQVLCTVQYADKDKDDYLSDIWLLPTEPGAAPRKLTAEPSKNTAARWSPDGRQIAFLSDRRDGTAQLYLMPGEGGEARQITNLARGANDIRWRPDGQALLALGNVTVDPDAGREGARQRDGAHRAAPDLNAPQRCWRLPYKMDGRDYTLHTRNHLFLVAVPGGQTTQLTAGDYDVRAAAWSPDGNSICIARTREADNEYHCTDIWLLHLQDGQVAQSERLSVAQSNSASPSWSPDGRWIVFMGAEQAGDAQNRLWLIDLHSKKVSGLGSASLEVLAGDLCWSKDSRSLGFVQVKNGLQCAASIAIPAGEVRILRGGDFHVGALVQANGLAYTREDLVHPQEVYFQGPGDAQERAISHFNDWRNDRHAMVAEYRRFQVPDGNGGKESVDAWILRPDKASGCFAPSTRPLLLDFHGGPASYVDLTFASHAYWQMLASQGWTVVSANAVGSSSYGRAFCGRLRGKWGELDLPQHLDIVRQLQADDLVDAHVAVTGNSYGGFMAAYSIAHESSLKAAVVSAPVANIESHFGTSDSGYYSDTYSMDLPQEDFRRTVYRLSPTFSIEHATAPTLFIQGLEDQRCPRSQTEELYVKLAYLGQARTEMVLYPGGSHSFAVSGKPSHRVDLLERMRAWMADSLPKA